MYYITVSKGLLEKKHVEAISESIWLFLWFLDRTTKIKDNVGFVLGGKPIKYEEIDLGISRATYKRWLIILKKYNYIKTTRTAYGLIVHVNKCFKIFNKRRVKNEPSRCTVCEPSVDDIEPSNKIIQLDNTIFGLTPNEFKKFTIKGKSMEEITYEYLDDKTPKKYSRKKLMAKVAINYMKRKGEEGSVLRYYPDIKELLDKSINALKKDDLDINDENLWKVIQIRFNKAQDKFKDNWGLGAIIKNFNRLIQ